MNNHLLETDNLIKVLAFSPLSNTHAIKTQGDKNGEVARPRAGHRENTVLDIGTFYAYLHVKFLLWAC